MQRGRPPVLPVQYNAETAGAAFAVQLRHHVGLDVNQQHLISVVYQASSPPRRRCTSSGSQTRSGVTATAEPVDGGPLAHRTSMG
jgi:hypothetical protein